MIKVINELLYLDFIGVMIRDEASMPCVLPKSLHPAPLSLDC